MQVSQTNSNGFETSSSPSFPIQSTSRLAGGGASQLLLLFYINFHFFFWGKPRYANVATDAGLRLWSRLVYFPPLFLSRVICGKTGDDDITFFVRRRRRHNSRLKLFPTKKEIERQRGKQTLTSKTRENCQKNVSLFFWKWRHFGTNMAGKK